MFRGTPCRLILQNPLQIIYHNKYDNFTNNENELRLKN